MGGCWTKMDRYYRAGAAEWGKKTEDRLRNA